MWLIKDVYFPISEYLNNKEKIQLTMTSKEMNKLKFLFLYKDKVEINLIADLSYYDNFENIASSYVHTVPFRTTSNSLIALLRKGRYPKNIQYHHYTTNTTYFFLSSLFFVPNNTLIECEQFRNEYFFENVPFFVTHLTFVDFNQPIIGVIPSSVIHLNFGNNFNKPIAGFIPSSVTHLTFGNNFNQPIDGFLPATLTHLVFGNNFDRILTSNSIPKSVTDLTLGNKYFHFIPECVLRQVVRLKYGILTN